LVPQPKQAEKETKKRKSINPSPLGCCKCAVENIFIACHIFIPKGEGLTMEEMSKK